MYKNKMIIISVALSFGLLTACDSNNKKATDESHPSGHEVRHNESSTGEHNGHGAAQQAASHLKAAFVFTADTAKANETTELTIQITDHDGNPVNDFDLNHEKLLHLIIVNQDLSYFNHIHPEFEGEGRFTINTSFPAGGEYKLFADFMPTGGSSTTLSERVRVEGQEQPQTVISADTKLVKEVSGKEVKLALSRSKPKEDVTLTFNIKDAKTKKGIVDLEPYLGAVGHVVILSADGEQYIHVHPLDERATGPVAEFSTSFPIGGTYKLWGQFQHEGEVFTVPFVVEVKI
jgi:hypothetical protein